MLGCSLVRWDCRMGWLDCRRERLGCRKVMLGCMMDLWESNLGLLVNMMEMLGCTEDWRVIHHMGCWDCSWDCLGWAMMVTWVHTEVSWESRRDSLPHELGRGCTVTWQGSQVSRAGVTMLD